MDTAGAPVLLGYFQEHDVDVLRLGFELFHFSSVTDLAKHRFCTSLRPSSISTLMVGIGSP